MVLLLCLGGRLHFTIRRYFISASVDVIELISKILCVDDLEYQRISISSKEYLPNEEFQRTKI